MRQEEYLLYNMKLIDVLPPNAKTKVLAYSIKTDNMEKYFLRVIDTKLVHPDKFNVAELLKGGEEFVKVPEEIYHKYFKILNNESRTPLRSLERLLSL